MRELEIKTIQKDRRLDGLLLAALIAATLPFSLPALDGFFTFDDLMNLTYYTRRPLEAIGSNLIVFTSFHRPLGALFYLPVYYLFGLQPFFYYLVGIGLFSLNVGLLYTLYRRLTCRLAAFLAASLAALHPTIHNVLYNFGGVFELTSLTALVAALLCYLSFLEGKGRKYYWLTLLCWLVGLNAKETSVVLPALLVGLEVLYGNNWHWSWAEVVGLLRRTLLLWIVAFFYTLAKALGEEAYWRDNSAYVYQLNRTILGNFSDYLTALTNQEILFSSAFAFITLVVAILTALVLRNRTMLFGLFFGMMGLCPVLPLPRVWDLFLYIPVAGFALYVASFLVDLVRRIAGFLVPERWIPVKLGWFPTLVLASLYLFRMEGAMAPTIHRFRAIYYQERTDPWKSFARQLWTRYPAMSEDAVLAFVDPPFPPETNEQWCLHFLVRLKYGSERIRVYRLPEQNDPFYRAVTHSAVSHLFSWKNGRLSEEEIETRNR